MVSSTQCTLRLKWTNLHFITSYWHLPTTRRFSFTSAVGVLKALGLAWGRLRFTFRLQLRTAFFSLKASSRGNSFFMADLYEGGTCKTNYLDMQTSLLAYACWQKHKYHKHLSLTLYVYIYVYVTYMYKYNRRLFTCVIHWTCKWTSALILVMKPPILTALSWSQLDIRRLQKAPIRPSCPAGRVICLCSGCAFKCQPWSIISARKRRSNHVPGS